MTLDADILERPAPTLPPGRDPRIAVREVWLCMLLGLREIGMRCAAFLAHRVAPSEGGPRRPMMAFWFIGDPCAAFKRVSRAVHLAAALALRIADEIAALRAGKPLGPVAPAPEAAREAKALRDELQEIGFEALAEDIEAAARPEGLLGDVDQLRREARMDPAFYRLLDGPLKDAVAAICADLGLKPDWRLWTEDGFPPAAGRRERRVDRLLCARGRGGTRARSACAQARDAAAAIRQGLATTLAAAGTRRSRAALWSRRHTAARYRRSP